MYKFITYTNKFLTCDVHTKFSMYLRNIVYTPAVSQWCDSLMHASSGTKFRPEGIEISTPVDVTFCILGQLVRRIIKYIINFGSSKKAPATGLAKWSNMHRQFGSCLFVFNEDMPICFWLRYGYFKILPFYVHITNIGHKKKCTRAALDPWYRGGSRTLWSIFLS